MPAITVRILGDADNFKRATKTAEKSASKLSGTMKAIGGTLAATQLLAFGKAAVTSAADDAKAQTALATTLKNAAGARDSDVAATEKWIAAQGRSLGISDDKLRPALTTLALATGDVAESQRLAALAMDISAATGKPLEAVAKDLAKAQLGSMFALKKYGVQTKDADGKTISFAAAQDQLKRKTEGAAEAAGGTAAGKMQTLGVRLGEIQETIGSALIPIISKLGEWLLKITDYVEKNSGMFKALAIVFGTVLAVILVWNAAMAVSAALTAAMAASAAGAMLPFTLIVVAIAAVIAILVIAYNKIGWFRDAVDIAFKVIKTVITTQIEIIKTVIGTIIDVGKKVIDWFKKVGPKLFEALKTVAGIIIGPFKYAFNAIARLWNSTIGKIGFTIPDWVPGIGGSKFDVPDIPELHTGGVFRASRAGGEGLAMLRDGERVLTPGAPGRGNAGGGVTVIVNVAGNVRADKDLARVIKNELIGLGRRGFAV